MSVLLGGCGVASDQASDGEPAVSVDEIFSNQCPPLFERGTLHLDINPGFLHVDKYDSGSGLTVSSFFNAFVQPGQTPPLGFFAPDQVGRIPNLDELDPDTFDASDFEVLTDLNAQGPRDFKTVWPNETIRVPDGVLPFEAVIIPQGFQPAPMPGRLTVIDMSSPDRTEYIIHQSTQNFESGFTFPGDPANSPRFYHKALFYDVTGDGLDDIITVRSGFRVGPFIYPPFAEMVYFENPGDNLDPNTPWREVVLYGGPAAEFLGPDVDLDMHDFEGDGVPEIVATHFFSGGDGQGPPINGKIVLYGAPEGGTWADVDASRFALPRMKDLSTTKGLPFGIQIVDLNLDGRADILATNHQPDGCTPPTTSPVSGMLYALQAPLDGAVFDTDWTEHVLLDGIRPQPTPGPANPPGRLAPGKATAFHFSRAFEGFVKPSIVMGGDEAGKVWILRPNDLWNPNDWSYNSRVIFDINDHYGEGTTQTPMLDPFGITISTIGQVAVRFDRNDVFGRAEIYIPVFEAKDIHVLSARQNGQDPAVECLEDTTLACGM